MQATELLKSGHQAVRRLFQELAGAPTTAGPERRRIFDTIAGELELHAQIEEELFLKTSVIQRGWRAIKRAARKVA